MGKQKLERKEKPNELIRAEKLIDEGKLNPALQILSVFEEEKEHTLHDIVLCHLLKCNLLFQQGKYEDVIKLAEQTYKESLGLGKNLLSVDALMLMPHPLLGLYRLDKAFDIIKQGEELLKSLTQELPTEYMQREADIAYNKANLYQWGKSEVGLALEQAERCLALREESGSKQQISQSLRQMAWIIGIDKGELDRGLKYVKRALSLSEESNNKYNIAWSLNTMGVLHTVKGEIDRSILLIEQALLIFKELNNKPSESWALNNMGESYRMKGELDRAIECLEQALSLSYETGNLLQTAHFHDYLIQFLVENGEIERAQRYLHDLEKLKSQMENKFVDRMYLLNKALILKTNPRASNQGEAEEILKHILEDEDFEYEIYVRTTLNLCELLLTELQLTNDLEVLDEIKTYIVRLLSIAEESHSYWILGEIYLIQARLALISLDLTKTRRLMIQGQQIAETHGLKLLARKISDEHDKLLKQLYLWEKLKEEMAPLNERIELARLNEQIETVVKRRVSEPTEPSDEEPVVILIIVEGGVLLFSHPFTDEWEFDDELFGGFLTAINSFSDEIFSIGLDRAIFGEYTLLMEPISTFVVCYLFKGDTYPAQQKIKEFIEGIENNEKILQTLNNYNQSNREIQLKDVPALEQLINETFITRRFGE